MVITFKKHELLFKFEAGTSRGILKTHIVYYVSISYKHNPEIVGIGECAPLAGLSIDHVPHFESTLISIIKKLSFFEKLTFENLNEIIPESFPSMRFGFETALFDLINGGNRQIFMNDFSKNDKGIAINGLIWMGDKALMINRIKQKLNEGYTTLKLKIGAIDFDAECEIIENIRSQFSENEVCIRVDANGAFKPEVTLNKLNRLAKYKIHSIEQPIKAGQAEKLQNIIKNSPIPIALDEELIGIFGKEKEQLITFLKPHYLILKPTVLGGIEATKSWIQIAENLNIKWWFTSALESNIGLNAIAQFAYEFHNNLPQGLGTGQLYLNNIPSPLIIENAKLFYDRNLPWNLAFTI